MSAPGRTPATTSDTGKKDWTDEEFFRSGEQTVSEEILTDMINICQGKEPRQMRVLEIGCGAGRITRALAGLFGEVHAVDVSGEMVAKARAALADRPNAHVYQNNGKDLSVIGDRVFDFAFSTIVFQHIPSYEVIESYVREVHRLLRPGALFKFQVQGDATLSHQSRTIRGSASRSPTKRPSRWRNAAASSRATATAPATSISGSGISSALRERRSRAAVELEKRLQENKA